MPKPVMNKNHTILSKNRIQTVPCQATVEPEAKEKCAPIYIFLWFFNVFPQKQVFNILLISLFPLIQEGKIIKNFIWNLSQMFKLNIML